MDNVFMMDNIFMYVGIAALIFVAVGILGAVFRVAAGFVRTFFSLAVFAGLVLVVVYFVYGWTPF